MKSGRVKGGGTVPVGVGACVDDVALWGDGRMGVLVLGPVLVPQQHTETHRRRNVRLVKGDCLAKPSQMV